MNKIFRRQTITLFFTILLALSLAGCDKCPPVTLKTIELKPTTLGQGSQGFAGSHGTCLSAGSVPPTTFSPGAGQVMVGFDNFFDEGFFCDDLRAQVFRGLVAFDVSQFDSIVSASFLFDSQRSVERITETIGSNPPKSFATTLGQAVPPLTGSLPFDNEVSLPPGPNIDLGVTSQVKSWVDGSHSNGGFVIAGPTGLVDPGNMPENNEAKVSWYGNFRLRIVYNPSQNPRAPQ